MLSDEKCKFYTYFLINHTNTSLRKPQFTHVLEGLQQRLKAQNRQRYLDFSTRYVLEMLKCFKAIYFSIEERSLPRSLLRHVETFVIFQSKKVIALNFCRNKV